MLDRAGVFARKAFTKVRNAMWRPFLKGDKVWCPVCQRGAKRFLWAGVPSRPHAQCPWCGSYERHRLLWSYIASGPAPDGVLHVAPEESLAGPLRLLCADYVSVDLKRRADVKADITQPLPFARDHFDMIVCSHVLEHIPDDLGAVRQLMRVLRPHGRLLIAVPVADADETIEEPIDDPATRLRVYGQADHVRCYGRDVVARLESCGLVVEVRSWEDLSDERERLRIDEAGGEFYVCREASQTPS